MVRNIFFGELPNASLCIFIFSNSNVDFGTEANLCFLVNVIATHHVKVDMPVFLPSLKSRILSLTSCQMDETFWGHVNTAVEQLRREANMVALRDGKFST